MAPSRKITTLFQNVLQLLNYHRYLILIFVMVLLNYESALSQKNIISKRSPAKAKHNSETASYRIDQTERLTTSISQLEQALENAKTPVQKLDLLNRLAARYYETDSAKTFFYTNEAILIADKLVNISAKGRSYFIQGLYYSHNGNFEKSITTFKKAAKMQYDAGNKVEYGGLLTAIGQTYVTVSHYNEAIPYLKRAIEVNKQTDNKKALADSYNSLGVAYSSIGQKDLAIKHYLSSLDIVTGLAGKPNLAKLQVGIATLYSEIAQYDKADYFFKTAIRTADELNDERAKYIIMSNLGNMYMNQKRYEEATNLTKETAAYFEKIKMKYGLFVAYNNLGAIKIRQEDYKSAIPFLKKSLENVDQINDKNSMVIVQQNIAFAYTMIGDYNEASKWFNLAKQEVVIGKITPYAIGEYYNHLATLDSLRGNFREALQSRNNYFLYSNKIANEKISKQINELQIKYETAKKESQISLLNKENSLKALQLKTNALELDQNENLITQQEQKLLINDLEITNKNQIVANQKLDAEKKAQNIKALQKQTKIQDLELSYQKLKVNQRNLAIGLILVLFIAAGGFAIAYYNRSRLKQENLLQAEIYKQQEVATRAVFEGEQNERIRIARDLHDGIGQMLSVVKMNVSTLNPDDKTVGNTLNLVDKTIDELRSISHNLIPEALNFGLYAALEDICQKINDAGQTQVNIHIAENVQHIELAPQNKLSVYRIVQEVLNNMVKHANASQINVEITKGEANMLIAIKDNGVGFDTAKINDSKGIGWKNISARVHLLDGDMNIRSEKLLGTQIEISIPA